jgi:hypothetical protein
MEASTAVIQDFQQLSVENVVLTERVTKLENALVSIVDVLYSDIPDVDTEKKLEKCKTELKTLLEYLTKVHKL